MLAKPKQTWLLKATLKESWTHEPAWESYSHQPLVKNRMLASSRQASQWKLKGGYTVQARVSNDETNEQGTGTLMNVFSTSKAQG